MRVAPHRPSSPAPALSLSLLLRRRFTPNVIASASVHTAASSVHTAASSVHTAASSVHSAAELLPDAPQEVDARGNPTVVNWERRAKNWAPAHAAVGVRRACCMMPLHDAVAFEVTTFEVTTFEVTTFEVTTLLFRCRFAPRTTRRKRLSLGCSRQA